MAVSMNGPMVRPGPSYHPTVNNREEEWEDWSDDEPFTPIQEEDGELTPLTPTSSSPYSTNNNYTTKPPTQRTSFSAARQSMQRIRRVRSRQRQKAQNASLGIKLITDMTKLRQQQLQQQLANQEARNKGKGRGKFADAAALNALEGMASDESIGTFAWLRKKRSSPASATPVERRMDRLAVDTPTSAELSPGVGGIMIGFAMPSDSTVVISPQTAVVDTPVDFDKYFSPPPTGKQPVSVWSPDTPDSQFTINSYRTAGPSAGTVPAVPAVPNKYRDTRATEFYVSDNEDDLLTPMGYGKSHPPRVTPTAYFSDEDDDMATPVTLFEEDGSPVATRQRSITKSKSPVSATLTARSQQGWWDQITSPFTQSPVMSRTPVTSIQEEDDKQEWWKAGNNNGSLSSNNNDLAQGSTGSAVRANRPPMIVIEDVSQVEASSSSSYIPFAASSTAIASSSSSAAAAAMPTTAPMAQRPHSHAEKARILIEENEPTTAELPPPYSPPKKNQNARNVQTAENVRYRAVFPPSHPLNSMYPPSPGPISPGLAQTMTSQGAIDLPYVPARPPPARPAVHHRDFPAPPLSAFVPATQRLKAEEKRRRNEKEDAMARKVGGLWRGRGCIPASGCFGRPGREGRKRRRWCLALFLVALGLIALAVALGVVLSRPKPGKPAPYSPWLNLTDFPPIPTGISTVIGTDSVTDASCAQDPRFWSCALPKDQTAQAEPFAADQPSFIIQIQFDNSTQKAWNVTGQAIPTPTPTKDAEATASPSQTGSNKSSVTNGTQANQTRGQRPQSGGEPMGFISVVKRLLGRQIQQTPSAGFIPRPSPPEFQDMYFLGNNTDGIVSAAKAGEPTPFYISILRTLDDSVGPNMLTRRNPEVDSASNQLSRRQSNGRVDLSFIPPVLNSDGTGAPAILMPFPTQQPLRLFDRGLPTEHFGFYTYFNKTVYLTGDASSDRVGGSTASDSKFVITWLSARYKVEIWTRQVNATRLLGSQSNGGAANNNSTRPGSFPYPVTVTLDTHGGIPGRKFAFSRGVADGGKILMNDTKFILNNMNQTGDWVNPGATFNPSFGGMDGGTGGCQCRYTNWVKLNAGDA
ncbi:hypothetical protein QBC45DRAFT_149305 [Copromyces sp. CBS 386.78]|nr:hypothetical protein QBC45DRAFT_149305 [Copromyces sp. CBS 386.78]